MYSYVYIYILCVFVCLCIYIYMCVSLCERKWHSCRLVLNYVPNGPKYLRNNVLSISSH